MRGKKLANHRLLKKNKQKNPFIGVVLSQISQTCVSVGLASMVLISLSHAETTNTDQINQLITQAIQTHPLVNSARAEQQATQEGIHAAKLNLLPAPSISSGYDKDKDLISQVRIRQALWTGGKLTANVNQAIFDDKAAVEHVHEQQNEVAKNTIEAWQSYITAVAMQRVYANNIKRLNEFEAMMQRRVSQGVSARIELDLVTNRILQEQNSYQGAIEQQRIAAARLEQITGHQISATNPIVVPDLQQMTVQAKRQSAIFEKLAFNDASFYNPTVVKQRYQIESAKQEVKAKEASRYPTIYAQYQHTYYHKEHENDGLWSLGLDYEPGSGLSNLSLARASGARVQSLVYSEEAARRKVIENIQIQYQQFASTKDQELSLVAAVAGAQIVANSYSRQFIAGRKSWLDVLNAVREQSQYEIQLVQARANMLGAFYKLQVDFGIMPWQQFQYNRQPIHYFRPMDTVPQWLGKQEKEYEQEKNEKNQDQTKSSPQQLSDTPLDDLDKPVLTDEPTSLDMSNQQSETNRVGDDALEKHNVNVINHDDSQDKQVMQDKQDMAKGKYTGDDKYMGNDKPQNSLNHHPILPTNPQAVHQIQTLTTVIKRTIIHNNTHTLNNEMDKQKQDLKDC